MVEGRQEDEWAQTMALMLTVGNLFAGKGERVDVRKLMPAHLRRESPKKQPPREATPEQAAVSWAALRGAFKSGRVGQKG